MPTKVVNNSKEKHEIYLASYLDLVCYEFNTCQLPNIRITEIKRYGNMDDLLG